MQLWTSMRRGQFDSALAAFFGVIAFLVAFGLRPLDVTDISWVMSGDSAQHFLGWHFFRESDWQLPLGMIERFHAPFPTTVLYTDSIPIAALLLRPLAPLLPPVFQYLGPWLLLCCVLQGYAGHRLLAALGASRVGRLTGAGLLVLMPPLWFRYFGPKLCHIALCSHFLLLFAMTLVIERHQRPRRQLVKWTALLAVAAAVHGYLFAMCSVFFLVYVIGILRTKSVARAAFAGAAAGVVGLLVFELWLLGVIGGPGPLQWGHTGVFAANLDAPFNSMGFGTLLPGWSTEAGREEGFLYLGAGGLLIAFVALGVWLGRIAPSTENAPAEHGSDFALRPRYLFWGAALLWLFALSNRVMLARWELLDLSPIYRPVADVADIFLSTGRFGWPIAYLAVAAAVAYVSRRRGRWVASVLAACLLLQCVDILPTLAAKDLPATWSGMPENPAWTASAADYDGIYLVPPNYVRTDCRNRTIGWRQLLPLLMVAQKNRWTITGGYSARPDKSAILSFCTTVMRAAAAGVFPARQVLVFDDAWWRRVRRSSANRLVCGDLDGYHVCVVPGGPHRSALEQTLASEGRSE